MTLATAELTRPDDSTEPFEIAINGSLLIRVTDRVLTRLEGVHVTGGDLNAQVRRTLVVRPEIRTFVTDYIKAPTK